MRGPRPCRLLLLVILARPTPPPAHREEERPGGRGQVPARTLQQDQRRLEVGGQGHGAAARRPLTGAVRHVEHLRDLSGRIGDHGPGQRGHCFGAQAGFHGQQEHDAIPRRRAGGDQVPQNRPLLGRTDNLGLLALHGDTPVNKGSLFIR